MSHDTGAICLCRATHSPHPLELNEHHILPLAMGGPDVPSNRVFICPTGHANVHELLRHMLRDGPLTWGEVGAMYDVPVSRYAFDLAHEGLRRFREQGWVA